MYNLKFEIDKESIIDRCKVASAMVAKASENFDLVVITDDDVRITDAHYKEALSIIISSLSRYSAFLIDGEISISVFGDFDEKLIPTLKESIEDFVAYSILSLWFAKVDEKTSQTYAASSNAVLGYCMSILSKRTKPV